eukprot:5552875-Pyramimonas_sp.AAC.1
MQFHEKHGPINPLGRWGCPLGAIISCMSDVEPQVLGLAVNLGGGADTVHDAEGMPGGRRKLVAELRADGHRHTCARLKVKSNACANGANAGPTMSRIRAITHPMLFICA